MLAYVIAPVLLAVACLFPTRYMGASWRLALLVSVGVSMAASTVVILSGIEPRAISFALISAPGIVALSTRSRPGPTRRLSPRW